MKPNIVFFFSDQQRYDTLGCNGQPLAITPNIDAFAKEGINFKNAFTPQPVCGPARSCLQTGLYATQTGCFKNGLSLPMNQKTLAMYLRQAGYNVAYVGKWHLASDEQHSYRYTAVPMERRGGYNDYWYGADALEHTSHGYDGYVFDKDCNKVEFTGLRADRITDFAVNYIDRYDDSKPFFLFVSHIEPHHQNDRGIFEGPIGSKEAYANFSAPPDLPPGKGDWETQMPDYLGCCNALDRNFGRVISSLKKKNLYDNTLLIYTSDHGCHFKTITQDIAEGGGDDYKRNSFENTIHIPLVIKGPGFTGGKTESKLVSLLDLPKTLMTAAGCEHIDIGVQGRALQTIFDNSEWDNSVYIQISESYVGRAVRTERFKYVVYAPDKNPLRDAASDIYYEKYLFDLAADPLEKNNLINDTAHANIKQQLKDKLTSFAKQAGEGSVAILELAQAHKRG